MDKYLDNYIDGKCTAPLGGDQSCEMDVAVAVRSAHKALKGWSDYKERSNLLARLADSLEVNREELAKAEAKDLKISTQVAEQYSVMPAIEALRYFSSLEIGTRTSVGVCGIITPFPLSLFHICAKLAPALLCGNTVVCKPSEKASSAATALAKLMSEFPAGVINFVYGKGDPVGSFLVKHPGVPLISFTGTSANGEKIYAACAPFIKKLSLGLSGKSTAIVLADADLTEAVPQIARSCFLFAGQSCFSTQRIFVQEGIAKEFVAALAEHAKGFSSTLIDALAEAKFKAMVELARKENGHVVCDAPTVIEDLTNCSEIHQSEILGPFATVNTFKYPFDAVKQANVTPYGSSASIWTKGSGEKVAAGLEVGTVWINGWFKRDWARPFSGRKLSGLGRSGGTCDLDFFSEPKSLTVF